VLSPVQRKLFEYIKTEIAENGSPPRLADMAAALGCSISSARDTLMRLERRGFIRRTPNIWRSCEVLR
jgi:SOS-response transcriptional repressor LexA